VSNEPWDLPDDWYWSTIGDVCRLNERDRALRALPDDLEVTFVPMAAIDADRGAIARPERRPLGEVRKGFTPFSDGDVLLARITPSMENGKAAVARRLVNGLGFGSTEFHVMRPGSEVLPEWVYHFIRRVEFRSEAKANFAGTAGQLRVPDLFVRSASIPVAPLAEQKRIVDKVEGLLEQSRTAREALDRIPPLLKRFRQAVLAAAFRGELTERDASDEPASVLLERIREERRRKWEEHLRAKGKDPRKAKCVGPKTPDAMYLPELPERWVWTTVGAVTDNFDGLRVPVKESDRNERHGPFPYYGASGIIDHVDRYLFDGNYLLVGEDGANLLNRASPIAFRACGRFWVNNHAHVLQTLGGIPLAFLEYYFGAVDLSAYVTGTAQPKMTQAKMNSIPVPLAPQREQWLIVDAIGSRLAHVEGIEKAVTEARRRAESVDRSILVTAFRGEA